MATAESMAGQYHGPNPPTTMVDPSSWEEVLLDSEASLRLVDRALFELRPPLRHYALGPAADRRRGAAERRTGSGPTDRPVHTADQIADVVQDLRDSRARLELGRAQMQRNRRRSVVGATRAPDHPSVMVLDGLDRVLSLLDELEAMDGMMLSETSREVGALLRLELFDRMSQLTLADRSVEVQDPLSAPLAAAERTLCELARLLEAR